MPGTEKTQHISLTTQVENRLKHQLSIGALKPGARLITKNIAQELGVSITPVREALLRLVSSSALAVAPAQAFMVPGRSRWKVCWKLIRFVLPWRRWRWSPLRVRLLRIASRR